ncbi:MAG TPA: hypothetical protein DHU96_32225 [Actinobacteria bacterium]|nr:hypothetical protein [Actinomycetota bacterium]
MRNSARGFAVPAASASPRSRRPASTAASGTAGAVDSHVHLICPQRLSEALDAGSPTLLSGPGQPASCDVRFAQT